jgi:hypothetical protein
MRRVWSVLLFALGACATAGDAYVTPPPASFREVRSVLLVRMADDRAGRQKDPLDGLEETLRARGYTTRLVELGTGKKGEHAALDRLFVDLEARAGAAPGERFGAKPYASLGRGAADTVAALGVDAVASYHRLDGRRPLGADAPVLPGTLLPGPPVVPVRGPTGAIALVDRTGHVATFAWGATSAVEDPEVPVNAAEAIDLAVRALTGEPPEPE